MKNKLDEAMKILLMAESYMNNLGSEIVGLNKIKVSDQKGLEYINLLLPLQDNATEQQEKNVLLLRTDIQARYFNAPDLAFVGKNGYRFIIAESDFATHFKPLRETASFKENMFMKTVEGNPFIDKAYEIILASA